MSEKIWALFDIEGAKAAEVGLRWSGFVLFCYNVVDAQDRVLSFQHPGLVLVAFQPF
jgi:hypothetical protein